MPDEIFILLCIVGIFLLIVLIFYADNVYSKYKYKSEIDYLYNVGVINKRIVMNGIFSYKSYETFYKEIADDVFIGYNNLIDTLKRTDIYSSIQYDYELQIRKDVAKLYDEVKHNEIIYYLLCRYAYNYHYLILFLYGKSSKNQNTLETYNKYIDHLRKNCNLSDNDKMLLDTYEQNLSKPRVENGVVVNRGADKPITVKSAPVNVEFKDETIDIMNEYRSKLK